MSVKETIKHISQLMFNLKKTSKKTTIWNALDFQMKFKKEEDKGRFLAYL